MSNLVRMTRVWKNIQQVCSKSCDYILQILSTINNLTHFFSSFGHMRCHHQA